jgi:hypothetical protein
MFQLALSAVLFITVLIIGIILLKNLFKIVVFVVSAALVFLIVAGALIFLDIQSFTDNFFSEQNQILLRSSEQDKIISALVIDFDNESQEGNLMLQNEEMIKRADGFFQKDSLHKQPDYYKHLIFESESLPGQYELADHITLSRREIIDIIESDDSIVALRDLLDDKIGEEEADRITSRILAEIKNANLLKSFMFKVMISKLPEQLSIDYLMEAIKSKEVKVVPETPIFTLTRYFPRIVDLVVSKIQDNEIISGEEDK